MSQDQTPEKVKLYSGGGAGATGPRGVRAVSGGGGAAQRRRGDTLAAAATPALTGPEQESGSGISWLVLVLFVLGCAAGGALFTAFVPF